MQSYRLSLHEACKQDRSSNTSTDPHVPNNITTLLHIISDHAVALLQEACGQPHDIIALHNDLQHKLVITASQGQPHTRACDGILTTGAIF